MSWYKTTIPSYILAVLLYNNVTGEEKEQSNEPNFDFSTL